MKDKFFGIIVLLLVLTTIYLVGSVTRTISDSQDNKETLIRNSNGNYWEPIGANIQVAIDDVAMSGGGKVWLPPGTFNVNALDEDGSNEHAIELKDNVALIGSGRDITIIETTEGNIFPVWAYADNVMLKGFTVNMHNHGETESGNGVYVRGNNMHVEDISSINANFNAIYISECTNSFFNNLYGHKIDDIDATGGHGIAVSEADYCVFSNLVALTDEVGTGSGAGGMDFWCRNSVLSNLLVLGGEKGIKIAGGASNNTFNNVNVILKENSLEGGDYGYKIQNCYNSTFSNIKLTGGREGILVDTQARNLVFNNVQVVRSQENGLTLLGKNIKVSNAQVISPGAKGFDIGGENIVVTNSLFFDVATSGVPYANEIRNSKNIVFSDNKITKTSESAYGSLFIDDSEDVIIKGNQIEDGNTYGIYVSHAAGTCKDFIISDNIIRNNGQRGIFITDAAHDNYIITNNIVGGHSISEITDLGDGTNKIVEDNLT
ncbi:right-handed parallel beta-helix repeat-containing protein [archaeon]|nr:right-handed parallel beta-helix repeat-containing protein [archaeon]